MHYCVARLAKPGRRPIVDCTYNRPGPGESSRIPPRPGSDIPDGMVWYGMVYYINSIRACTAVRKFASYNKCTLHRHTIRQTEAF